MAIAIIRLLEIVNVEDKKGIPSARCPGKYCFDQAFRFPFTVEPGHLIQHGLDLNFLLLLNILSIGKHVNRVIFRRIENVGIYSHPEILICVLRHLEIIAQMMIPAFIFPDNIGRIKGRDIALPELFFYLLIGNDTQTLAVRQIVGAQTFKILPRSFPDTAIFSDIDLIDIIIELFGGSDKAFLPFLHQLCNLLVEIPDYCGNDEKNRHDDNNQQDSRQDYLDPDSMQQLARILFHHQVPVQFRNIPGHDVAPFLSAFFFVRPNFQVCILFPPVKYLPPDIMAAVKFKPVCLHMPIVGSGDLYGSVFPQQSCCDIEFIFIRPEQLFQVIYPDSDTDNPEDGAVPRLHFAVHKDGKHIVGAFHLVIVHIHRIFGIAFQ